MTSPIVSICCVTYNHVQFIRKALDGFLMQEPPSGVSKDESWYEILIHDDASTDGTTEIIKEYVAKYPDKIFPIYETENQYAKVGAANIDMFNYSRVKGRYVAYCEGDDYWTDPYKLQTQVDFMDTHPEYSICWHRFKYFYLEDNKLEKDSCGLVISKGADGADIDLPTYFSQWTTQPLTMLFRASKFDIHWRDQYNYYRDQHEMYHLLKQGKGYLFAFVGGVYIKHKGGIYSSLDQKLQKEISLKVSRELYEVNKDVYTRKYYSDTLQWLIYENRDSCKNRWSYSWDLFKINHNIKCFVKNILR